MAQRLNWEKAKPRRPMEFAIEGVILRNRARTPILPKDSLALRAERAEEAWLDALVRCEVMRSDELQVPPPGLKGTNTPWSKHRKGVRKK